MNPRIQDKIRYMFAGLQVLSVICLMIIVYSIVATSPHITELVVLLQANNLAQLR